MYITEAEAESNIGEADEDLEFTMWNQNLRNGLLLLSLEANIFKIKSVQRAF